MFPHAQEIEWIPFAPVLFIPERFDRIRQRMEDDAFRNLLGHSSHADAYFENIANALLEGEEHGGIIVDACPAPFFKCTCSHEKMAAVVKSIPTADRMEIVKEGKSLSIGCQFCNTTYEVTIDQCVRVWNDMPMDGDEPLPGMDESQED